MAVTDERAARTQLLQQIQRDLQQQQIPVAIDERAGTLALPGLLDFAGDTPAVGLAKRPGLRALATILARRLPCFTQSSAPMTGCGETSAAIGLDALVLVGTAGPAPVGSTAFRYQWHLAHAHALHTLTELLENQPALHALRNRQGLSLFRLDGSLPLAGTGSPQTPAAKPTRRVELRFVMGAAAPTAHPPS